MTEPALLTVAEYAHQARVTERTIRRWIAEGRLRAIRQGKKYLIPREDSAAAQVGGNARPRAAGAAKPIGDAAVRYLLFWICDQWVDGGAALRDFVRQDPSSAERYFHNLVADLDRDAASLGDPDLALRLRFIARDLLATVLAPPTAAEATAEPDSGQVAPTAPLSSAETLPVAAEPK
jgi:excisionase family DNA binding protein